MGRLHPEADKLLFKICEIYNKTGKTEIDTMDIVLGADADSYFYELESAGYIEYQYNVFPVIKVLDRTILFAQSIKN
ncbi:hypothetical protein [Lacrimispora sp.]|uniref:hypothetical protein n=1 Tax=Lacrimispora sp. TaxID=2719234 RepID=UPI0028AFA048|nr:hypothetical protein [Lacrimispora sp.]